jgi:hypothetical protein
MNTTKDSEINRSNKTEEDDLLQLVKSYSEKQKDSEANKIHPFLPKKENFKADYQIKLSDVLEKYGQKLFSTEEGCLLAKFTLFFGGSVLTKERLNFLISGLKEKQANYPIISELNSKIKQLRSIIFNFFEEYKKDQKAKQANFTLLKTGNYFADYIIKIDIERMMDFQKNHFAGRGPNNSFFIDFEETEDEFLIKLKR